MRLEPGLDPPRPQMGHRGQELHQVRLEPVLGHLGSSGSTPSCHKAAAALGSAQHAAGQSDPAHAGLVFMN